MVNQWGRDAGPSGGNPGRSAGALIAAVIALVVGASGGYGTARYVQGDTGAAVAARDQTISDLQSDLDAARSKTEKAGSREKSLEAELADLDAELKSLQSENDRLRAGKSDDVATAKEIKDLRAKLKTAEKTARDFAAAQDVIDQVQADLAKAQKAIAARDAAIKDLRAALADGGDLQAEIVRLTREKDVLVTELRDAQADRGDASQLEGEFRDLKLQAADLRDKLKQESTARARAEDRADAAEADVAKLTRRVSTLEDKLAGAETVRPRPGDTETKPRPVDPGQDEVGPPRDVDDVRNALADMPGYDTLASDKQKKLVKTACLLFGASAGAAELEKNIMTGGPKGTYIKVGRDIAALGKSCGQTLNVVESAGSLENFSGVRKRKNTQFGIVQSDVLDYLKTFEANDPEIQQAVKGVRIMFPLYNEEVHVLARTEIKTIEDLAGKKVAVGVRDSGTFLTATLILDILDVDAQQIEINQDQALKDLEAGKIDAFFYVAGAPAALFDSDKIDGAKFHLLPITQAPLLATYIPAKIEAKSYPFQKEPVDVVSVKAVLMTFDYDKTRNAYHRESCKAVADFSSLVVNNLAQLKESGHPKWKSVDLTAIPPGWKVGVCVKEGLAADYKPACAKAEPANAEGDENDDYLKLLKERLKK